MGHGALGILELYNKLLTMNGEYLYKRRIPISNCLWYYKELAHSQCCKLSKKRAKYTSKQNLLKHCLKVKYFQKTCQIIFLPFWRTFCSTNQVSKIQKSWPKMQQMIWWVFWKFPTFTKRNRCLFCNKAITTAELLKMTFYALML